MKRYLFPEHSVIVKSADYMEKVKAIEDNRAEIARLQGEYNRLSEANKQDLKTWEGIWQEEQGKIAQLQEKLKLAKHALKRLGDWPGWGYDGDSGVEAFACEALEAIEKVRDGE